MRVGRTRCASGGGCSSVPALGVGGLASGRPQRPGRCRAALTSLTASGAKCLFGCLLAVRMPGNEVCSGLLPIFKWDFFFNCRVLGRPLQVGSPPLSVPSILVPSRGLGTGGGGPWRLTLPEKLHVTRRPISLRVLEGNRVVGTAGDTGKVVTTASSADLFHHPKRTRYPSAPLGPSPAPDPHQSASCPPVLPLPGA